VLDARSAIKPVGPGRFLQDARRPARRPEIELQVAEGNPLGQLPTFEVPGMPGASVGMLNLGDIFGKAMGGRTKPRRLSVSQSHDVLMKEEVEKLLDQERVVKEAILASNGIVFLTIRSGARSAVVGGRQLRGVQRACCP
jgi:ATP-dependent HslUV protease ATP-binding subunit HslU